MTVTTFLGLRESSLASSVSTRHLHLLSMSGIPKIVNIKKIYKKNIKNGHVNSKHGKKKEKEKIKNTKRKRKFVGV